GRSRPGRRGEPRGGHGRRAGGRQRQWPQRLQDHAGRAPRRRGDRRSRQCKDWRAPPMSSVADWEAATNPVKENRAGIIGKAVDRYEGPLKVTGTAAYAYEVEPPSPPVYGVMVSAPIARGRITAIDTAAAEASPGVQLVWTYRNAPAQGPRPERYDFFTPSPRPALESDQVHFFGQQVAVVIADTLAVHTSVQMVRFAQNSLAETLMVPHKSVRLLTRYVGGGFGGKGSFYEDLVLASLAARELRRPVKIAFSRQQMMHGTVHRPATEQRVRLGATPDGRLTAMSLMTITHCDRRGNFTEHASNFARNLYAAPNRLTGHRLV